MIKFVGEGHLSFAEFVVVSGVIGYFDPSKVRPCGS